MKTSYEAAVERSEKLAQAAPALAPALTTLAPSGPQGYAGWGSPYESSNWSPNRAPVPGETVDYSAELTDSVLDEIIRKNRYLHKNSGFSRGMTSDMQLYSVATGIVLQSLCDDKPKRKAYEDYFAAWGVRCEVSNRFSLAECQVMVCRAMDTDGGIFVIKRRNKYGKAKIQLVEVHRLKSPGNDTNGKPIPAIELDEDGAPAWYHFQQDDGSDKRVPANAVLHVFEPESISALRTPPPGQHSINHLIDEMEMLALEKLGVKDEAQISRSIINEKGEPPQDHLIPGSGTPTPGTSPKQVTHILGGKTIGLKPNEKIESYKSERPNPLFAGFLKHLRRDSALGQLPFEFTEDSSAIGGAAIRLIVGKAARKFSYRQFILFIRFLLPVWAFIIGDGIDNGPLAAVPGWNKVVPQNPQDVNVDAGYTESADLQRVSAGLGTLEDYYAKRNQDFDDQLEVRKANARSIMDAAGYPASDPIPLWMIYAPPGLANIVAAQTVTQQPAPLNRSTP